MPRAEPLVSVLMNCRNGERYLRAAIDSVIVQTYQNWEIVFWDNRSTDGSAAICKSYADPRIRYFHSDEDSNLGGARAFALAQVRGELVAVLDVDDLWLPCKLELQVPCFDDPEVGVVISDTLFFTDDGKQRQLFRDGPPPQGRVFHELVAHYFVSLETAVLRKSAIDAAGVGFDSTYSHICDLDLITRLSFDWKLVCVEQVLAQWRVHAVSASWAEPDRFYREKLEFIRQMDANPIFRAEWPKSRALFVRNTEVSEAIACLARGDIAKCRSMLAPYLPQDRKALAAYTLSWLPFGSRLMDAYRRRKAMC